MAILIDGKIHSTPIVLTSVTRCGLVYEDYHHGRTRREWEMMGKPEGRLFKSDGFTCEQCILTGNVSPKDGEATWTTEVDGYETHRSTRSLWEGIVRKDCVVVANCMGFSSQRAAKAWATKFVRENSFPVGPINSIACGDCDGTGERIYSAGIGYDTCLECFGTGQVQP